MKIIFLFALAIVSATGAMDLSSLDMKKAMELGAMALYRQQSIGDKQFEKKYIDACVHGIFLQDISKINFYLYTREQPEKYLLKVGDKEALKKSSYKTTRPTKFIIHGWLQEGDEFTTNFKNAYLEKEDYNVIGVDWSAYSDCIDYNEVAQSYVPNVGKTVAQMLIDLKNYGADVSTFHIIGHSLGAHVAGYAGKTMKLNHSKLQRITGLDPAGPAFANKNSAERLDKEDADFVDVIHTNTYMMGSHVADGHANFYPNGGSNQMSCTPLDVLCNHQISVDYYVESISNPKSFCSLASPNYFDFLSRNYCSGNGDRTYMGAYVDKSASGFYYLITNERKPYSMNCQ